MVCLEEIAAIANILKTAPASTVQLLHKIINDEPYSLLATFWIFFRCGQLIFRMADCEVKALLQAPLASPQRGQCPRRGKGETKEGTSELNRIRWDRKRGRRASAEQ
ncbi:hypothetical protein TNCV_3512252 [Trichonephila clavipes]|nr:hypothetical protein TNCV_3512252 [Trichonephila clavipes]